MTLYKHQLQERKKLSTLYGKISYKTILKISKKANLSQNILIFLEKRLDIALIRIGFFSTIFSARQSIYHKKVYINGQLMTYPGYQLTPGDILSVTLPLNEKKIEINSYSKPINFEISYKLKKAIYLYSPQKIDISFLENKYYKKLIKKIISNTGGALTSNFVGTAFLSGQLTPLTPPLQFDLICRSFKK